MRTCLLVSHTAFLLRTIRGFFQLLETCDRCKDVQEAVVELKVVEIVEKNGIRCSVGVKRLITAAERDLFLPLCDAIPFTFPLERPFLCFVYANVILSFP